jgi:hypothetical protein
VLITVDEMQVAAHSELALPGHLQLFADHRLARLV